MISRSLFVAVLFTSVAATALAQSDNMTLVGQLDPRPGDSYSDVWTYVGPGGTEYALLASWINGGLNVIDVTDDVPVAVGFVPMSGDGSDVEAYGHYTYLTSNSDPTLIIDIEDPENPVSVGTFGGGFHTLSIVDGYLYGNGGGGVEIFDLADPENPTFVGNYSPHYVHDVLVRNDTMYTAGIFGEGIDIVNVSDKANPTMITRFNYPGSGVHNFCTDPSGAYLYAGDEIGSGQWTRIFDVRDPQNVELVGEIIVDSGSTVHNCHTKDNLLYLAHYGRGVWVFDIADPVNPTQLAYYDGPGQGSTWTANPHLPSGKIVASDIGNGLLVLRIDSLPTAAEPANPELPVLFALEAAYPNPFNPSTTLRFSLDSSADIRLSVLDAVGREVALIAEGSFSAGQHETSFDAKDLPSGLYLVRLEAEGRTASQRITLLK